MTTFREIRESLMNLLFSDSEQPGEHFWRSLGINPGDEREKSDLWEKSKKELDQIAKPPLPFFYYPLFFLMTGTLLLNLLDVPYSVGRDITLVFVSFVGGLLYFAYKRQEYSQALRNHLARAVTITQKGNVSEQVKPASNRSERHRKLVVLARRNALREKGEAALTDPMASDAKKEAARRGLAMLDALERNTHSSEAISSQRETPDYARGPNEDSTLLPKIGDKYK